MASLEFFVYFNISFQYTVFYALLAIFLGSKVTGYVQWSFVLTLVMI